MSCIGQSHDTWVAYLPQNGVHTEHTDLAMQVHMSKDSRDEAIRPISTQSFNTAASFDLMGRNRHTYQVLLQRQTL